MRNLRIALVCFLFTLPGAAQVLVPTSVDSDRPLIDVESYSIKASIDPFERELVASAEIRFIQLDRQAYAVFDLDQNMRVIDVYLGEEEPLPVRFRQFDIDSTLEVDLADLGQFDQPFIRVEYAGVFRPQEGRGSPILARIGAASAFFLDEARWYPMNGVGQDAAIMNLDLTLPSDWRVASALSEVDSTPPDFVTGTIEVTLQGTEPSFWGTLAAGPYETISEPAAVPSEDSVGIEALVFEDSVEAARKMSTAAVEMFRFYTETFGESVTPAFRIVEIDGANWVSRSVPGMLLLPAEAIRSDFDPWELAQYVANQWFPLKYTVSDPEADAWLGEGMAIFSSLFYFEETLPLGDADEYVERTLVKALSYEGGLALDSVARLDRDSAEYRALAGFKGGFVFRMLRDVMGEEAFRAMLDEFPATFAEREFSTQALLDVSSQASGEDLTYFFDQWINASGIPEFTRDYTVFRTPEGFKIMGQINQDLDLFRMPIEVEVLTDGESEFHQTWVSGPSSDLDLITERKPGRIDIDPQMRVLRLSPDIRVAVSISRGEDFANIGEYNRAIDEYQVAIDEDRLSTLAYFRMGEALFELGNLQAAANVFREALNGDLEPRWVEVWAYVNLGKIYDIRGQRERAVTEYQKAVNTSDDAYGAQGEAEQYIANPFRRSGSPTVD
jgi:hypothetical protein